MQDKVFARTGNLGPQVQSPVRYPLDQSFLGGVPLIFLPLPCSGESQVPVSCWGEPGTCVLLLERARYLCPASGESQVPVSCFWREPGTFVLLLERARYLCPAGESQVSVSCFWREPGTCVLLGE